MTGNFAAYTFTGLQDTNNMIFGDAGADKIVGGNHHEPLTATEADTPQDTRR
jgi:hypothetical protein